jgi:hypothetical protein
MPVVSPEDALMIRLIYPTGWSLQNQAAIHRFHLETTSRYLDVRHAACRGTI